MPPAKQKPRAVEQKAPIEKTETPIGKFASIEDFTKDGFTCIVQGTAAVNTIPQGASRDLYCAYPSFGRIIDQQSDRILGLIAKILRRENVKGNIQRRQNDEKFEMLLECNDSMLERINTNLDELSGIKKKGENILDKRITQPTPQDSRAQNIGSWNKRSDMKAMALRHLSTQNIMRPQLNFAVPVDNRSDHPFEPKLKEKPNSLKPLAILPEYDDAGNITSYLHPYEFELMKFEVPEEFLKECNAEKPPEAAATELVYVETVEMLHRVVDELRNYREIAVDVEHHSYRSFMGFTCLVQISTRDKDYIFDAIELREDMHILNIVFTDPKVVKILHGADSDVEWLQRDLAIYLVNMFDTHQAAITLNFARHSLAYVLKHYCNIDADKTYQMADWRIRPLPTELIEYARQDTHYLIYIYERMTNDLLKLANNNSNLLRSTYQRSTELCKKRYTKPHSTPDAHMDLYQRSKRIFDNRQMYAFREIYMWRDGVARSEDESIGYVLPNHMILQIAETLPREMQGILACCNPVPPLVRQHLHALHQIILRAREQPLVKPVLDSALIRRMGASKFDKYQNRLHCPHDFGQRSEVEEPLPTLLKFKVMSVGNGLQEETCELSTEYYHELFGGIDHGDDYEPPERSSMPVLIKSGDECTEGRDLAKRDEILNSIQYLSPYQRYKAVLPQIEKERREEAARLEAAMKERQLCPSSTVLPVVKPEPSTQEEPQVTDEDEHSSLKQMLRQAHARAKAVKKAPNDEVPAKRFKLDESSEEVSKLSKPKVNKAATSGSSKGTKVRQGKRQVNVKPPKPLKPPKPANQSSEPIEVSDEEPDEQPSSSAALKNSAHLQGNRKASKKNARKFKAQKSFQSSNKAIAPAFDYSSVNFKKFQGGAQRAKGAEFKGQFQGKGNKGKAQNKKFNKLFTFGNVKAHKK